MFFNYTSEVGPVLLEITNGLFKIGRGKEAYHDITPNASKREPIGTFLTKPTQLTDIYGYDRLG
jgi:hypothetical protein